MSWILTRSGVEFDLLEPTPEMVDVSDISHSLSKIQRFNGHTDVNANVALHSVMTSYAVKDKNLQLYALMHDAAEAYIGDIASPLKQLLGDRLNKIEEKIERAIFKNLGVSNKVGSSIIKLADLQCLKWEMNEFLPKKTDRVLFDEIPDYTPPLWLRKYYFMNSDVSEKLFITRFTELSQSVTNSLCTCKGKDAGLPVTDWLNQLKGDSHEC
jgi:uncharacterized protein